MTFQESIKTCFSKYAEFNGSASRPEYWWFALFVAVTGIALTYISSALAALFYLATLIPSIAAAARRLHDTNRSGWWQLIGLIPVVGWVVVMVFLAQEGKPARDSSLALSSAKNP